MDLSGLESAATIDYKEFKPGVLLGPFRIV
jgi:hypothetical protein